MGVLTSKSMAVKAQQDDKSGGEKSPSDSRFVYCVRLDNAPQGKTNAAFILNGETKVVKLVDGLYKFKSQKERRQMRPAMLKAGFKDADYLEGGKPAPVEKREVRYMIRYAHPDNEPDSKKEGHVAIKVGKGKGSRDVSLELDEHGTVKTDDPEVQKKLESLKWDEIGRYEILAEDGKEK